MARSTRPQPQQPTPMEVDINMSSESKEQIKITPEMEAGTFETVRENCRSIERGESTKEVRFMNRVLRSIITIRRQLNDNVLWRLINYYFVNPDLAKQKEELLSFLKRPTDDLPSEGSAVAPKPQRSRTVGGASGPLLPEVEAYLHLLVILFLMKEERFREANECIRKLLTRFEGQNRRTMDPIMAKILYFYAVVQEQLKTLTQCVPFFHERLRSATLRYDEDSQATLINCLLRAHLNEQSIEPAATFLSRVTFPASAGNNEWARYHYYTGKIRAMELRYPEAKAALQLAMRKAPQHTAIGFRQTVQVLAVTVDLLLGTIPERALFRQAIYRKSLAPYLSIAQAVRMGSVERFDDALTRDRAAFEADHTYTLVIRLRQNVIKTALRQISLAYSRISIVDIQKKLRLTHPDDAEYIVAKAIKDGVIDAEIDHAAHCMKSRESGDVYSTSVPQREFHTRIQFCMDVYNQAIKAMRFPPKSYAKEVETAEEKREREQQELEFAKEMADDEEDGFS